ncbi:MAG: TlpA disulfide reductase family protein [Myxococcota bacterium]
MKGILRRIKRRLMRQGGPTPPPKPPKPPTAPPPPMNTALRRPATEDAAIVSLSPSGCTPMNLASLKALLGAGQGVRIVNHWATWCDPCVEELPLLIELSQAADVIGISWDLFEGGPPASVAGKVARFSEAHGLRYPSALVSASPEDFFAALEMTFRRIPQTWVIDGEGERLHTVEGILDAAAVETIKTFC